MILGMVAQLTVHKQEQELSISDINQKYHERWVAMIVTQRDQNMQPTHGRVVADDLDRFRLRQKIIDYYDICIFYSGKSHYPLLI
jgi:hypothetical protein